MAFEEPAVGVVVIVCVRIEPLRVTTWTLVIGVPAILEEAGLEEDSVGATAEEVDAGVEVYSKLLAHKTSNSGLTRFSVCNERA
jgi:hypothetical protein